MQIREFNEYVARRDWTVVDQYVDLGVSGSKERRPELDRMMNDARRRKFDVVVCWKLDRMGRSLRHLVNLLAEFEALGVMLVSMRDNLDLTTPSGRLMFGVIAAMAEFERSLIQERVKAGIRNARSRGKKWGRARIAVDAAQIASRRSQGASWATICREMGIFQGNSAEKLLQSAPKAQLAH
jgi:DNA invertase Pin-like site-specific DNA recombinase